jgi:hypothetical protein
MNAIAFGSLMHTTQVVSASKCRCSSAADMLLYDAAEEGVEEEPEDEAADGAAAGVGDVGAAAETEAVATVEAGAGIGCADLE